MTLLIRIPGWELPAGSGTVEAVAGSILSIQEKNLINTEGEKRKEEPIFYLQERKPAARGSSENPTVKINSSF